MTEQVQVFYEATPNPQSMKFVCTKTIADQSVALNNAAEAARSPLAAKLFTFPWMQSVFIGPNFVTISKQDWVEWNVIAEPLSLMIQEHLNSDEAVLLEPTKGIEVLATDSEVVRQIKQILNDEIRPAVAMDGGDITFDRYENQVVYLHMQGSCSGCPSSAFTLKEGIETRLKEAIPEIQEVISVN